MTTIVDYILMKAQREQRQNYDQRLGIYLTGFLLDDSNVLYDCRTF